MPLHYFPPLLILTTFAYVAFAILSTCQEMRRRAEYRSADSPPPAAKFFLAGGAPEMVARPPHPAVKFFIAGVAPATVAVMMTLIFYIPEYIKNGVTIDLFSLKFSPSFETAGKWALLCFVFLPITALSALGSLIWLVACAFKKALRPQIPAAFFSILYSVFAFFAAPVFATV